jgi:hypothetical protein
LRRINDRLSSHDKNPACAASKVIGRERRKMEEEIDRRAAPHLHLDETMPISGNQQRRATQAA